MRCLFHFFVLVLPGRGDNYESDDTEEDWKSRREQEPA